MLDGLLEKLLEGRFRPIVDWLIDYQATTPETFSEEVREHYAAAYGTPDAIRGGNGYYKAFPQASRT